MNIICPIIGDRKALTKVDDEVFSQKILGEGIAITPKNGCLYAPIQGVISMLFPSKHAIGIKGSDGIEILIHIGIDTVELGGVGFESYVKEHDQVRAQDPLIRFDLETIHEKGYCSDVMIIITNSSDYATISMSEEGAIEVGEVLIQYQKK